MALNGLIYVEVPLRNYSLACSLTKTLPEVNNFQKIGPFLQKPKVLVEAVNSTKALPIFINFLFTCILQWQFSKQCIILHIDSGNYKLLWRECLWACQHQISSSQEFDPEMFWYKTRDNNITTKIYVCKILRYYNNLK